MKRLLAALAITLILVYLLLRPIQARDIADLLSAIRLPSLALAGLFYACQYLFRTLRFRLLTRSQPLPFVRLYGIVCLHNFFNYLLPMRSGELSYPLLARKYAGVGVSEGVGVLLVGRILDLIGILALFMLSLFLLSGKLLQVDTPLALATSLLFLAGLFLLLRKLGFFLDRLSGLLERLGRRVNSPRIGSGLDFTVRKTREVIRVLEPLSRGRYLLQGLTYTFLVWLSFAGTCYILMQGFGLQPGFLPVLFGASLTAVTGVLPVSGLGNFGTMEAGWSIGLWMAGLSKKDAIASAFGIHIFILVYVGLLALAGAGILLVQRRHGPG